MTVNDLMMIKGIRRVEEIHEWPPRVVLRVSPWWLWSKKRRSRLERTLHSRMMAGLWFDLKAWWW